MPRVPISETKYARNGDVSLAYQVVGDGPVDAVFVPGFVSHVELNWQSPFARLLERLGQFCRLVVMDKRGTGLSDRSLGVATLEDRMDDVRAVLDAAGMESAAVVGISEGGPMAILMAATHPDRVRALVLYGSFARVGLDVSQRPLVLDLIEQEWGSGRVLELFVSGVAPQANTVTIDQFERYSCTPLVAREIMRRNFEIDVRAAVPSVRAPALIVHCAGDPAIATDWGGRELASLLPNARYVELERDFHLSWDAEEMDAVADPIEEFLTGRAPVHDVDVDRVLATVLFTDIVDSTLQASALGDRQWRLLLDRHDAAVRAELARHRGTEVNTTGDGFIATFDGPARAIRCAQAICRQAQDLGIDVRAGVHTGECERRGDDLAGIAVHIGARVAGLAGAGEVLVSSTVRDLVVGSGIGFSERGVHTLKGVPGEWQLLAVSDGALVG